MSFFVQLKKTKTFLTKQLPAVPIDFHDMGENTMEINSNCLVTNILQNIFSCVQQKKQIHTGLEQHEGE